MSDDDGQNDDGGAPEEAPTTESSGDFLEDTFGITKAGSTVETEIRAGVTTFLTLAYILFVNPNMLALTGMPFEDALFATAVAAFVGCVIMGLWANLPFALAPGMGLNAYFTFSVVLYGFDGQVGWEIALAAVLVEGILFLILSLPQVGARSAMINAIPKDLKIATMAGIGMFLAIIGFREMGWIQDDGATLVNIAATESFTHLEGGFWALIGLVMMAALMAKRVKGAIVISILVISVIGWGLAGVEDADGNAGVHDGYNDFYDDGGPWNDEVTVELETDEGGNLTGNYTASIDYNIIDVKDYAEPPEEYFGFVGLPEETMFAAFSALGDIGKECAEDDDDCKSVGWGTFMMIMIAFFFVDIFDTSGTLYGVSKMAGLITDDDEIENSDEAFMSDAGATIVGSALGTSTVTSYIESAAGVEEGGRTGLTAVVAGCLFLTGLFFAGIFKAIPTFAVAPALVVIGAMMMRGAAEINWKDMEIALPAFITMVFMPFTYSIADGIAWGLISYVMIKLGVGKHEEIIENKILSGIALLMVMFYLGPGDQTTFEWILDNLN